MYYMRLDPHPNGIPGSAAGSLRQAVRDMLDRNNGRMLIVAINFSPELTGIGKYVGEMTESLSRAGIDIRVVTAPPYYPGWKIAPEYSGWWYSKETLSGATVYRCPLFVPKKPGGLLRIAHLLSFAVNSLPVVLWNALIWRPHMVFVVEPPLASTPGALLASKLCGARSWLHVQDFEVDAAFDLGLLQAGWMKRLALAVEKWLMRRFDRVSSISERMIAKLAAKGLEPSRIGYLPNWVDTELIQPATQHNLLREELDIPSDTKVLLYSGNMGEKQGLDLIIEVARAFAHDQDVLFLLCGDGAARPRIEAAAAGLSNVRFMPLQPLERLNELLNLADIHLLPQRADAEDLVMPSKLTAIMASARPVVASARPESDVARASAVGGMVVQPGNAAAFEQALHRLLHDEALRLKLGSAGREFAISQWDRRVVMARVITEVDDCMARGSRVLDLDTVN